MNVPRTKFDEPVTISVERMMRFCYLAEMQYNYASYATKTLPLHLTRFGTLALETASFLYSLFEDSDSAINVPQVWKGFDHPFIDDLHAIGEILRPLKEDLRLVRNRLGFHGSLSRDRERAGLRMFDVDSGRAHQFVDAVRNVEQLFLRMIAWYVEGLDQSLQPKELWNEFLAELRCYSVARSGP